MKIHIFTIALYIIFSDALAQIPTARLERFTTREGLSNNRIYSIIQDKKGFIWIGTLDGLNRYDGYSLKIYKNIPGDSTSLFNNRVTTLLEDSYGYIWMSSKNAGIDCFDPGTGKFTHYTNVPGNRENLPNFAVSEIFEDKEKTLWIKTDETYSYFNRQKKHFIAGSPPDVDNSIKVNSDIVDKIQSICNSQIIITSTITDNNSNLWIGTQKTGVFRYNLYKDTVLWFADQGLKNNSIVCIYQDRSDIVWIGTHQEGIYKYNPISEYFTFYNQFKNNNIYIDDISVRAITEDNAGNIWIGTYNTGLIKFNRDNNKFNQYLFQPGNVNSVSSNKIRALFVDKNGILWVGSYNGLSRYNSNSDDFDNFSLLDRDSIYNGNKKTEDYRVYNIEEDYYGNLWIANWENLVKLNTQTMKYISYPKEKFNMDNIREVYIDNNNLLWIGAEYGGIVKLNLHNENIVTYESNIKNGRLSSQNIFQIYENNNGLMWIATFNGLNILNKETGKISCITTKEGLASNMTYGIVEDKNENLWITTSNGLSKLNTVDGSIINYNIKYGLQDNEFCEGGYYYSKKSNEIFVGGIHGLNIFNPDCLKVSTVTPNIVLTSLKILNKEVIPYKEYDRRIILDKSIEYIEEIELTRKDKIISFEFTGLHYTEPEKIKYAYMMEGFDDDWVEATANRRYATYTNLNPGKYLFKVKAANPDGIWNENGLKISITIQPLIWETWYAFIVYAIVILILLLLFRKASLKSINIKNSLKLAIIERNKSEELNQLKLNFFTNISHDFRSTLSLILGPLEDIHSAKPEKKIRQFDKQFGTIYRSANHLLALINQILDFRKLEKGNLKLRAKEVDIIDYIKDIYLYYKELAAHKKISLSYNYDVEKLYLWIDTDKMQKIIGNLMSNAIKYTEEGGNINIEIRDNSGIFENKYNLKLGDLSVNDFVEISIQDTGIGIPVEVIDKIFQRFYQVDNLSVDSKGTGIGLALVKNMVDMHKGEILVKSGKDKGSIFTIRLPKGNNHLSPDEIDDCPDHDKKDIKSALQTEIFLDTDKQHERSSSQEKEKTILLVEDNIDFRNYIKSILNSNYNIAEAENGLIGLEKAKMLYPDLIISDVMMPKMDGLEFCKKIKTNIETCHIPVILLTAKVNNESHVEGMEHGADMYITKPFNKKVLESKIKNIISSRDKLKELYTKGIIEPEKAKDIDKYDSKITMYDKKFLDKVVQCIESNIINTEFNVVLLSKELGLSRSSLHNKLKSLTNQSATEFIRSVRIKNAIKCMKEGNMNIVEIAYNVGFNTPSYFIKCFKKQFGVTPKEYLISLNEYTY